MKNIKFEKRKIIFFKKILYNQRVAADYYAVGIIAYECMMGRV